MAQWRIHIILENTDRSKLEVEKLEINNALGTRIEKLLVDWIEGRHPFTKIPLLNWQGYFKNKAGSDNIKALLDSKVATWKTAGITGMISMHLCTHDELIPIDCFTNQYTETRF